MMNAMSVPAPMLCATSPPTSDPTTPSTIVMSRPIGLRPGTTRRASAPMMRPPMMSPKIHMPGLMPWLQSSEAHATAFALGDLDIGQLVGGDDDASSLFVGEG